MKSLRNGLLLKMTSFLMSSLILFISCDKASDLGIEPNEMSNLKKYEDVELFKGVVFKAGDLGGKLYPSYSIYMDESFDDKILSQAELIRSEIILNIQKNNPNYFSEFKSQITSKNHFQILKAIEGANELVETNIEKLYSIDKSALSENELLEKMKIYDSSLDSEACVVILVVALILFIIVIPLATDTKGISKLQNEQSVNLIYNF